MVDNLFKFAHIYQQKKNVTCIVYSVFLILFENDKIFLPENEAITCDIVRLVIVGITI